MNSDDIINLNKQTYNKTSKLFSDTRKFLWAELVPLVKYVKDGDIILDLGCGTGRLYQLFEKNQVEYTGVDNSEEQIKTAKKIYPGVNFEVGEMTKLQFTDSEFDVIYCVAAFHHLQDEEMRIKALQEMKRVLKQDGILIMTNWNLTGGWGREKVEAGKYKKINEKDFLVPWKNPKAEVMGDRFYHSFDEKELENLFKKVGFKIQEQYYFGNKELSDSENGRNLVSIVRK